MRYKLVPPSKMKSFRIDDILVSSTKEEVSGSTPGKAGSLEGEPISERDSTSEDEVSTDNSPTEKDWMKSERQKDEDNRHPNYQIPFAPRRHSEFGDATNLRNDRYWPYQYQASSKEGRFSTYTSSLHPYYTSEHLLKFQSRGGVLKNFGNIPHHFSLHPATLHNPLHRSGNPNLVGSLDYHYAPHGFVSQFGIPLSVAGEREAYFQNNRYEDRDHYPMYSLNRSVYPSSCKRKGGQIRFNNSQTGQLEKAFVQQKYLNATDRKKLAQSLGLTDRQVKTWFQNRRAKLRKSKGMMCGALELPGSPPEQDGSPIYDESTLDEMHDIKINVD